ncbi:MAG: dATP/dGTP diphosphohydrolase domain-containing protein [bacterium]
MQDPKEKDTNPKALSGIKKYPLSVLPLAPLQEATVVMFEGGVKYGRHNYRVAGCRASTYFDATMRHLWDWFEGQDADPVSGMCPITHAITSLLVLRDSMIQGKFNDDRPPMSLLQPHILEERIAHLAEQYPDPVEPWTEERLNSGGCGHAREMVEAQEIFVDEDQLPGVCEHGYSLAGVCPECEVAPVCTHGTRKTLRCFKCYPSGVGDRAYEMDTKHNMSAENVPLNVRVGCVHGVLHTRVCRKCVAEGAPTPSSEE